MIEPVWIHERIADIDARLAVLTAGRELLEQLRDRYEQLLALQTPGAEAVRNGSRTSADQAEERGFDSRPPLPPSPGPAGSGQGSRRRRPSSTPLTGSPASAPSTDGPYQCAQPGCSFSSKRAHGLAVHRARKHGNSAASVPAPQVPADAAPPARPHLLIAGSDPRNIDEECPRGCGRRFRWEPTLLSHIRTCKGAPQAEPGGAFR